MDCLVIRRLPYLSRRNFFYEYRHLLFWGVFAGVIEGDFAGVVISKTFHGGDWLIAIVASTPFAANLLSLAWGMLCAGRRKIPLMARFGVAAATFAAAAGLAPATDLGAIWFLVCVAGAQALLSGVVTVRTAVWRANYPTQQRGRITARLQRVRAVVGVIMVQMCAAYSDRDPNAYTLVYPAAAVVGLIAMGLLSPIRIRGEAAGLRASRIDNDSPADESLVEPFSLAAVLSPGRSLRRMSEILRDDRRYARYCLAQSIHGISNLITLPVVVAIVTREIDFGYAGGFWVSTVLVVALPTMALLGSLDRWGRLFDAIGVLRFRMVNIGSWAASYAFGLAGTLLAFGGRGSEAAMFGAVVGLFACRAFFYGHAQGGGRIAWNIGHLHFSSKDEAEEYMGIHVFLTGVRGLAAPLLGMWLWHVAGWGVWLVSLTLAAVSMGMFASLAREEQKTPGTT